MGSEVARDRALLLIVLVNRLKNIAATQQPDVYRGRGGFLLCSFT